LPDPNRPLTDVLRIPASANAMVGFFWTSAGMTRAVQYPEGAFVGAAAAVLPQSTQ
jgi:hypothetical protein